MNAGKIGSSRPGRAQGQSGAVRLPGQVLPGERGRGAGPRDHAAPLLPTSQTEHPQHGHLLPARNLRSAGLLRPPGQGEPSRVYLWLRQ